MKALKLHGDETMESGLTKDVNAKGHSLLGEDGCKLVFQPSLYIPRGL